MLSRKLLSASVSSCCDRQGLVYIKQREAQFFRMQNRHWTLQAASSIQPPPPFAHESCRSGHHWCLHPLCLVLQVTVFMQFPPKYLLFHNYIPSLDFGSRFLNDIPFHICTALRYAQSFRRQQNKSCGPVCCQGRSDINL